MISFIVCSIDTAKFAGLAHSLARSLEGAAHEMVGIHDARSLCEGWTRGLARAHGELVVFCHDDIEIHADGLAARLAHHLERYDLIGVTAAVAEAVRFDAETFDGWHGYDADFTFRAHRAGLRLAVVLDLPIVHHSRGRQDQARVRYHLRFAQRHADALATGRGPWVDAMEEVVVPDGLPAAYARANLARLQAWTREEARRRRALAERPYAAGRNDPCPCGSGLRYKECHGQR